MVTTWNSSQGRTEASSRRPPNEIMNNPSERATTRPSLTGLVNPSSQQTSSLSRSTGTNQSSSASQRSLHRRDTISFTAFPGVPVWKSASASSRQNQDLLPLCELNKHPGRSDQNNSKANCKHAKRLPIIVPGLVGSDVEGTLGRGTLLGPSTSRRFLSSSSCSISSSSARSSSLNHTRGLNQLISALCPQTRCWNLCATGKCQVFNSKESFHLRRLSCLNRHRYLLTSHKRSQNVRFRESYSLHVGQK